MPSSTNDHRRRDPRGIAASLGALLAIILVMGIAPPASTAVAAAASAAQVAARASEQVTATHDAGIRKMQAVIDRALPRINKQRDAYATEEELIRIITPIISTVSNIESAMRKRMSAYEARGLRQLSALPGGLETATTLTETDTPLFESLEAKAEALRDQLRDLTTPKPDPFAPPDREPPPSAPTPPTPPGAA